MKKRINNLPVRPKSTKLMKMLPRVKTTVKNGGKTKSSSRVRHYCYRCNRNNCRHSIMKCKYSKNGNCCSVHQGFCSWITSSTTTLVYYPRYTKTWLDRFIDWILGRK